MSVILSVACGFRLPHGRGDEFRSSTSAPEGPQPRDIYIPDLHIDSVKVKAKNFR